MKKEYYRIIHPKEVYTGYAAAFKACGFKETKRTKSPVNGEIGELFSTYCHEHGHDCIALRNAKGEYLMRKNACIKVEPTKEDMAEWFGKAEQSSVIPPLPNHKHFMVTHGVSAQHLEAACKHLKVDSNYTPVVGEIVTLISSYILNGKRICVVHNNTTIFAIDLNYITPIQSTTPVNNPQAKVELNTLFMREKYNTKELIDIYDGLEIKEAEPSSKSSASSLFASFAL